MITEFFQSNSTTTSSIPPSSTTSSLPLSSTTSSLLNTTQSIPFIEKSNDELRQLNDAELEDYVNLLKIEYMKELNELKKEDYNTRFTSLKDTYNYSTNNIMMMHDNVNKLKKIKEQQNKQIKNNNNSIEDINDINVTNRRLIEINLNIIKKREYAIKILQYSLIGIVILIIVPLLYKFNVIDKNTGLIIWGILVSIIVLGLIYVLYFKIRNRDVNNFSKFNFINPNSEEVARSKLNVDLSDSDQARCQAFSEIQDNYDTSNIKIPLDEYISKEKPKQCKL